MSLILPTQCKSHSRKPIHAITLLLAGGIFASGFSALAQASTPLLTTRQDQLFKEAYRLPIPQNVLAYPWMSPLVDYDNNGSLDIVLYGHHSRDAFIWRGAAGAAEYLPAGSWVFGVRDPIWLDVDKDGDMDGIGTEGSNIGGKLFINQGNGSFTRSNQSFWIPANDLPAIAKFLPMPAHIPPSKHPLHAKLTKAHYVDLDNDGKPELVANVTGQITFQTATGPIQRYSGYSWILQQQNGVWIDVTESLGLRAGLEQQFFPEDFDMDGDLDLVDLFAENIYRNDGYHFIKVNTAPIFGGRRPYDGDGEIDVIDLDNNGYRDFIFGGDHTSANGVYLNTGNFSFEKLAGTLISPNRRVRKFADLDRDGDIDLVAYNGKEMIVYDNVITNRGIHVTFEGDYFGSQLQVRDDGNNLVFNAQLFQHQTRGMSQVYTNTIHVGGITGPVQAFINKQAAVGSMLGSIISDDTASFIGDVLTIPKVEVDGGIYSARLHFTDPASKIFSLSNLQYIAKVEQANPEVANAIYSNGILTLPSVRTADNRKYAAKLDIVSKSPVTFVLTSTTEVP